MARRNRPIAWIRNSQGTQVPIHDPAVVEAIKRLAEAESPLPEPPPPRRRRVARGRHAGRAPPTGADA
jgi:hypothetical protein